MMDKKEASRKEQLFLLLLIMDGKIMSFLDPDHKMYAEFDRRELTSGGAVD